MREKSKLPKIRRKWSRSPAEQIVQNKLKPEQRRPTTRQLLDEALQDLDGFNEPKEKV